MLVYAECGKQGVAVLQTWAGERRADLLGYINWNKDGDSLFYLAADMRGYTDAEMAVIQEIVLIVTASLKP